MQRLSVEAFRTGCFIAAHRGTIADTGSQLTVGTDSQQKTHDTEGHLGACDWCGPTPL